MNIFGHKLVKQPTDVDGYLAEGRTWVAGLEHASKEAHAEANQINKQRCIKR